MNRLTRLIIFLIGLAGMVVTAVLIAITYPLGRVTEVVVTYLSRQPWALQSLVILSLIVFVVCTLMVLVSLLARPKTRALYITTPVGSIRLSQAMIEQTIFYAVQEKNLLKQPQISTRLNSRNQAVYARISGGVIPTARLVDASRELQLYVEQQLQQLLQIEKVQVEVLINERQEEKKNKQVPRVI
ncbi:alkaline shock response membrane anchor protein AmaP [Paenibacillus sp. WLX1005]|uniref:alkaline shock response membrane anchor protein AmaP n=1 Tax=Paenibacillus sp. WLX1005 TaxID=3243766 RepID=UPI003984528B